MMEPQLRVEHVTTAFGATPFNYDFALSGAGIVAVTGPSGAGKSTLFHLIAGFERPQAGRIVLNGVDVTDVDPGKRPLSYIFQDHNLFAHLDVFTNVALGISPSLRLGAEDRAEVSNALAEVGLAGFESRMPQSLSGGERQRAAFARALIRKRPFLLMDEPFASLDQSLRGEMAILLQRLQLKSGMMVLMITHDPKEIDQLADRVIEIRSGRSVYCGTVANWRRPAS
jgi:thiamine transport system ATP-binding protein